MFSPVEVSANIILILSKPTVVIGEAKAGPNLHVIKYTIQLTLTHTVTLCLFVEKKILTGLSMYNTEYCFVQAKSLKPTAKTRETKSSGEDSTGF